jgi:hypothetical protein
MAHDFPKQPQTLKEAWYARRTVIRNGDTAPAGPVETTEPPVEGEVEPDREAVWMQVMALAGKKSPPWTLTQVTEKLAAMGHDRTTADGWALQLFLEAIKSGAIV